ncbi:hypothetical protein Sme01_49400 [Sphaerisporangium melleum]|uniref:Uncharacterized protein n=1 Tax=Sphaerisporangium melleum TaxID=321316 RepID=A0A917R3Y5_9ACTN|nr:hypothetical protein GCM10007964_34780 [Sphaerisporangium melleum]GII72464.1 hypothetical protein Sme01_49400 [Sphaerisporangium melleum]
MRCSQSSAGYPPAAVSGFLPPLTTFPALAWPTVPVTGFSDWRLFLVVSTLATPHTFPSATVHRTVSTVSVRGGRQSSCALFRAPR